MSAQNITAPAPWSLDKWGHIVDATGEEILVYGVALTNTDQAKANTRLIAAAPELLEALIGLCEFSEAAGFPTTRARAAIAKATGGDDLDDAIDAAGGKTWL